MDTMNFPTHLDSKSYEIGVRLTIHRKICMTAKWIKEDFGGYFSKDWPTYAPDGLTHKEMQDAMARMYRDLFVSPQFIFKRFLTDLKSCPPERLSD
jgi:hypothetical protein